MPELKDLPEIKALLDVARAVIKHDKCMTDAHVGGLGKLAKDAKKALKVWDAG